MSGTYVPNFAGFAEAAVGPEIRAAVLAEAKRAQVIAESLSADFEKTGEYQSSFSTEVTTTETVRVDHHVSKRAAGIMRNSSPHAAAVEWGNARDHTAHRVFGRTAAALGNG